MPYKDSAKQAEARKRYDEKRKKANGERHKVWTLIFYPDSACPDWQEMISDVHIRVWVSPAHNLDAWTQADERKDPKHVAGLLKKPHYHLVAAYETQVDRDTFLKDFAFLNGPQNVKAVKSLTAMVRYLVHADDPNKAQYSKAEVLTFGGAEIDLVEQLGSHERGEALKAMRKFIRDHNVVNFCDFVDYCDDCEATWSALLNDNSSYVIEKYIKSRRYKAMDEQRELSYNRLGKACQGRPEGPGVEILPGGQNTTPNP